MKFEDIVKEQKKRYLSDKEIEFLIDNGSQYDNPNYGQYFKKVISSIPTSSFQNIYKGSQEVDKKLWAKLSFDWMLNYNKNLSVPPEKLAKICFKVFYGEDIESCSEKTNKLYTARDGRKELINN